MNSIAACARVPSGWPEGSGGSVNERLCVHVQAGNYEQVLGCLMEGAMASVVSGIYGTGRTAIGMAALLGDAEILELLIQSCVEPDLDIFRKNCSNCIETEVDSTPDGMDNLEWEDEFNSVGREALTPEAAATAEQESLYLYYAKTFERTGAIINSIDTMCDRRAGGGNHRALLQDPHSVDGLLMAPLHYAAAFGHLDCVKVLFAHGANPDAVNCEGYTPLHVGAEYPEITRFLLKHGANPNFKTIDTGETPLHLAIRNHCSTVANLILQTNANINETDDIEQTPLMCAINSELDDVAFALIERGAGINFQDNNGFTALYYAVQLDNYTVAARLLERGARRITSHYLLHYCVEYNQRQMAELLLDHGDNLNVRNREGDTPIMLAIQFQRAELLEYLLTLSRQSKFNDTVGQNELIFALQSCSNLEQFEPIARILLAHSEGMCWTTTYTTSSLGASGAALLLCYTPYCHNALSRAIMSHKLDIAEFLIKEGFDITHICRDHVVRSLRSMAGSGFYELAKLLVHAGFHFPYKRLPFPKEWKAERFLFEEDMGQLCGTPLTLKSLTRITIRRRLGQVLTNSNAAIIKYHATKQESSLSRMLKELEIPKTLKTFLIDFDDCPTVMNPKYSTTFGEIDDRIEEY